MAKIKKPILLMNHSLISKMDWCKTAPNSYNKATGETWKEKAYRELLELLCRVPFEQEPDSPADWGNRFEANVYKKSYLPVEDLKGSELFKQVVNSVRGGKFQNFNTKDMAFDNCTMRWYGITDVEFGDSIIDLKTTGKFASAKYRESGQDIIYRYVTGKEKFKYLITEWVEAPVIKQVQWVDGFEIKQEDVEPYLRNRVKEFTDWLKDLGYYDLYVNCYCHSGLGWKSMIAKKGPEQEAKLEAFYKPFREKFLTVEEEGF